MVCLSCHHLWGQKRFSPKLKKSIYLFHLVSDKVKQQATVHEIMILLKPELVLLQEEHIWIVCLAIVNSADDQSIRLHLIQPASQPARQLASQPASQPTPPSIKTFFKVLCENALWSPS
jgi:hypothetical protein